MKIRNATLEDAKDILAIYSPYIESSAASFELTTPSLHDFKSRMKKIMNQYPWFVAEQKSEVLGYCYASAHRERWAYQWSCEVTVYVAQNHHRKGIASKLYRKLFDSLNEIGMCNAFAGVTLPNEASIKLHNNLNFKEIAHYSKVGFKNEKWHDVKWFQLRLQDPETPKEPLFRR